MCEEFAFCIGIEKESQKTPTQGAHTILHSTVLWLGLRGVVLLVYISASGGFWGTAEPAQHGCSRGVSLFRECFAKGT